MGEMNIGRCAERLAIENIRAIRFVFTNIAAYRQENAKPMPRLKNLIRDLQEITLKKTKMLPFITSDLEVLQNVVRAARIELASRRIHWRPSVC